MDIIVIIIIFFCFLLKSDVETILLILSVNYYR